MDEQDEIPAQGQEKTHSPPKRKGATLDLRWPCSAGGSHKLSGSNQNLSARAPESITMMGATSWEQRTMDSMAQERGGRGQERVAEMGKRVAAARGGSTD